jgi:hypothetical protein
VKPAAALLVIPAIAQVLAQQVTPSAVSLQSYATQQFSSSISGCLWSAPLGTVNLAGFYQAPAVIPFSLTTQVTCAGANGSSSATVTLIPSSPEVAGLQYLRGGNFAGAVIVLAIQPPLWAANGQVGSDFDPAFFSLIPDPAVAGRKMITFTGAGGPPGPQGPPGPPGPMTCPPSGSPAQGIVCVSNPDGSSSPNVNTALIPTKSVVQSGPVFCDSTNGTTRYACTFLTNSGAVLIQYTVGMFVLLRADTPNTGGCSLSIDNVVSQGTAIKQNDGLTDPAAGAIQAGRFYWLFFDGTVFRMQ